MQNSSVGRSVGDDLADQRRRRRPGRLDDRRRTGGERERQRVAEPVGEEHWPDGEQRSSAPMPSTWAAYVSAEIRRSTWRCMRPWAGPSCRRCTARTPASRPRSPRGRRRAPCRRAGPAGERVPLGRAGHDHGLDLGGRGTDRVDLAGPLGRDHQDAGAGVGDDGAEVAAGQHRVHRDGDGADAQRGEEDVENSMSSSITMATRCSGPTPMRRSPAAVARTSPCRSA